MRLRYLQLRNYPPIKDIKISFASGSPLDRNCAIRFVVGVNGSGKSNLLRAVAEVFISLADGRRTNFPVRLIYELGQRESQNARTLVLDWLGDRQDASLWIGERYNFPDTGTVDQFDQVFRCLRTESSNIPPEFRPLTRKGEWPSGSVTPQSITLPSAVLAYTTGDLRPWRSVWSRNQMSEGLLESEDDLQLDERPTGWTAAQETAFQAVRDVEKEPERQNVLSPPAETDDFLRPVLVDSILLKCALLAVALPHSFHEKYKDASNSKRTNRVNPQIESVGSDNTALQKLLDRGGWHEMVSIAFRSHLRVAQWDKKLCGDAHDWWLCASEVIADPYPMDARRTIAFDMKGAFDPINLEFASSAREELQSCGSTGEALWTLLGGAKGAGAFTVFSQLLKLHRGGLFDDVQLRLRRAPSPDDESEQGIDVGVLRYEELSDGEQMVLGRMALFHLLEGQQDALLLLDEPETHFNDKWKREIVDIIDDAIGHTYNDVLISTHSAIVLSDVFDDEIVVVQKTAEGSSARNVNEPTFGTDPSALMMTVFHAEDSIGKRAKEFIESKLRQTAGTPSQVKELERLIGRMGSGFYRSELRTLLNTWRGRNA